MSDPSPCPVCRVDPALIEAHGDSFSVHCPSCGPFSVSNTALGMLRRLVGKDGGKATLVGYAIRRMQRTDKPPLLSSDGLQRILETETLQTPAVQADNLVRWLGEHSKQGAFAAVSSETHGALLGTPDIGSLFLILNGLKSAGLIVWSGSMGPRQNVQLTFEGWRRCEKLRAAAATSHRLAAVVSTDVVGSTKLMAADEKATLAALEASISMQRQTVEQHGGRLVKTTGDGTLSEFGSAVDAMQASLEILAAMVLQNVSRAEGKRVELRIGLALGDVSPDGDDITGDTVNLAARLQSEAAVGTICTLEHVRDDLANKLELDWEDLGQRELKGIGRKVRVVQVMTK